MVCKCVCGGEVGVCLRLCLCMNVCVCMRARARASLCVVTFARTTSVGSWGALQGGVTSVLSVLLLPPLFPSEMEKRTEREGGREGRVGGV